MPYADTTPSNEAPRDISDESFKDDERFLDTFYVLKESYDKGRGRTLDAGQVKVLLEALAQTSAALNECAQQLQEATNGS